MTDTSARSPYREPDPEHSALSETADSDSSASCCDTPPGNPWKVCTLSASHPGPHHDSFYRFGWWA
jgi:hypothetical protein